MFQTLPAVLHGSHLEWTGAVPEALDSGRPITVEVVVLTPPTAPISDAERRRRLGAILREVAKREPFASIEDPVAWQREIREDRPLPGREP